MLAVVVAVAATESRSADACSDIAWNDFHAASQVCYDTPMSGFLPSSY